MGETCTEFLIRQIITKSRLKKYLVLHQNLQLYLQYVIRGFKYDEDGTNIYEYKRNH